MNIKQILRRAKDALRLSAVIGCLALANCDASLSTNEAVERNQRNQLKNYRCTQQEYIDAERDFNLCNKTGIFASDCLLNAKQAYCKYIGYIAKDGR